MPPPMRMRPGAIAVSHTLGSSSTCGPSSSRPSCSISSTLPWTGQRQNASRRASSRWIRARFQGSELRSYQRHFCAHSLSRRRVHGRASMPPQPRLQVAVRLRAERAALAGMRAKTRRHATSLAHFSLSPPVVLLVAAAPASAAVPHTVQPGETLWSIAAANNLTTRTVAAFNGLSENAQVVLGSTINVPTVVEGAAALAGTGVRRRLAAAAAPRRRPRRRVARPPCSAPTWCAPATRSAGLAAQRGRLAATRWRPPTASTPRGRC